MQRVLKKAVLLFLLGWFPLQASALPLLVLLCAQDASIMHGPAVHGHAHAGDHSGHDQHGSGDDGSSPGYSHACCHNLSSAAVPSLAASGDVPAGGADPTPLFHPSNFFPEQPLPPPLAA